MLKKRLTLMINIFLKVPIFRKIFFIFADIQNLILSLVISNWFLKYNLDISFGFEMT